VRTRSVGTGRENDLLGLKSQETAQEDPYNGHKDNNATAKGRFNKNKCVLLGRKKNRHGKK
jgi:hypothetical protein